MAVNERVLRAELARIAAGLADHPGRSRAALERGRRQARRRREALAATSVVTLGAAILTWQAVTGPSSPPGVAAVACYADRVVVTRPHVEVGPGGVRLDVTNATAGAVRLFAGGEGAILPPGRSAVRVPLPPGTAAITCDTGSGVAHPASITVTDHRHLFVADSVDCARPAITSYESGDVEDGDPVALTARRLGHHLPATAVVEPAGYPQASGRRLIRVRQGTHVLGVAVWHDTPQPGTWTLDQLRLCAPLEAPPVPDDARAYA